MKDPEFDAMKDRSCLICQRTLNSPERLIKLPALVQTTVVLAKTADGRVADQITYLKSDGAEYVHVKCLAGSGL